MFDTRHGKELADEIYKSILRKKDVALWYEFYDADLCWDAAASDIADDMSGDDMTDLMAWVISEQDSCDKAWKDGFTYLFVSLLASKYELENFGEE